MRYLYSVVRFVPDPVRGEFVNVGLIVGCDETSEWKARAVQNRQRARCIDDTDTGALRHLIAFFDRVERRIEIERERVEQGRGAAADGEERLSESWLRMLARHSGNIMQLTPPAPIVADSVDEAFDDLFPQFVVDPESTRDKIVTRNTVISGVRKALSGARTRLRGGARLFERATVKGNHDRVVFDFVVANGGAQQLTQAWSFQVADQDDLEQRVKAWAWSVRRIRNLGGGIMVDGTEVAVPRDVDINAVYAAPRPGQDPAVMDAAMNAFSELGVAAVDRSQVDVVAERAVRISEQAGLRAH